MEGGRARYRVVMGEMGALGNGGPDETGADGSGVFVLRSTCLHVWQRASSCFHTTLAN